MIEGHDSAYPPSDAALAAASAAGRRLWAGYFAGPGILNGWAKSDFDRVRAHGLATFAYCSGWANPAAMAAQSGSWQVSICLDVEGGIRPDGPWVPGWLATSGAGLYGNPPIHAHAAPFHILAAYPQGGDPGGLTWPIWWPQPATPCGWQWAGSHPEFGVTVDSLWLDDWFAAHFGPGGGTINAMLTPSEKFAEARKILGTFRGADFGLGRPQADVDADVRSIAAQIEPLDAAGNPIDNLDDIVRNVQNDPISQQYQQIIANLRAGKYALKTDLPAPGQPDDDSAFVTKTALKTAIGGL
jgi:hypothetical protein